MKKIFITILYMAAALALSGCAKAVKVGPNDANKNFLEAWMEVHYPEVQPTELGVYIIEDSEGSGVIVEDEGYAIVDYKIMDLEGNISSFTSKETAKQLGKYDTTYYYGSKVWTTAEATIQAGLADALIGMKAASWAASLRCPWPRRAWERGRRRPPPSSCAAPTRTAPGPTP